MPVRVIHNKERSSFFSADSPLRILDEHKKLFYYHPNKEGAIQFNLPKGIYYSDNTIQRLPRFVPYKKAEQFVHFSIPEGIEIKVGDNPHKATIWPYKKVVLIDPEIAHHEYKPVTRFVLGHELGHNGFPEEDDCDIFSGNLMLDDGYNPTQIDAAKEILFKNNWARKQCVEHNFMTLNNRR